MDTVSFVKYTSYGNNFVIVDETQTASLSESNKSGFAYQATNINFGVGSDNLLIVQSCTRQTLEAVNAERNYWQTLPDWASADFIFRMFEPDGTEALCCGNGLMCIASFLWHRYGITSTRIMTEIPTGSPKTITIGTDTAIETNWANMGHPRRMPPSLTDPSATESYDADIDFVEKLTINFRAHDLSPFTDGRSLDISGYLVFTGEPHMVVFTESGISVKELRNLMFVQSNQKGDSVDPAEKRAAFGSWLIQHIGMSVNNHYNRIFPAGLNINFVQLNKSKEFLEYRCFERGIYRETLACGTGALAVSFVSRRLNLIDTDRITILPHRCRWEHPDAEIQIMKDAGGWFLNGKPMCLFEGKFLLQPPAHSECRPAIEKPGSAQMEPVDRSHNAMYA
jgi:diaminopimelate epimerase